jgi:DNA repair protein SbcD/Mre11
VRLLHVSDWHLGRVLGRVSRAPDHAAVLAEIQAVAEAARPDLIVHTGDLFDHARPAVDDMATAVAALRDLSAVAPVVVLAGNHDSAGLFAVLDDLLAVAAPAGGRRVRFVGRARHPSAGGILSFPAAGGRQTIHLAPLPFVHPNTLLDLFDTAPEQWTRSYHDQVREVENLLNAGLADLAAADAVPIFAAHLHVGGARFSSERPLHVSEDYATSPTAIPDVAYAAFGHIHMPQPVPGTRLGRYAGSAIRIDFGERDEEKSVVVVDAEPRSPASNVEVVPIGGGRPLRRVEGPLSHLATLEGVDGSIVQAIVDTDEPDPALADRLAAMWPSATLYDVVDRRRNGGVAVAADDGGDVEVATEDLFRDYLGGIGLGVRVDRAMGIYRRLAAAVDAEQPADFDELALFDTGAGG